MDAIFAVGQPFRCAGGNADCLRLVRRQGDPPRRVEDHRLGQLVSLSRVFHVGQLSVRCHAADFGRDPVRGDIVTDVVEDHFRPATPIEDNAGRRDQQVPDARLGGWRNQQRRSKERQSGEAAKRNDTHETLQQFGGVSVENG